MKEDKILISIIIPIYNVKGYVEKCIESVINQEYSNLEIILVDDGSTDGCAEICDEYAKRDSRVVVIHKVNGGLVSARKAGVLRATGDYVINVDGDDWVEKDWIKKLALSANETQSDIVMVQGFIRETGNDTFEEKIASMAGNYEGDEIRKNLLPYVVEEGDYFSIKCKFSLCLNLIKRELYATIQSKIPNDIIALEDVVTVALCLDSAKKITVLEMWGYHYVKRKTSICGQAAEKKLKKSYAKRVYSFVTISLQNENRKSELLRIVRYYTFIVFAYTNLEQVQSRKSNHLIPYPMVKKGSKVIIYGAGRVGRTVLHALGEDFRLLGIADSKIYGQRLEGKEIISIDEIEKYDFDYVIVAVMYAWMANEIKEQLLEKGVSCEKIAIMQTDDIPEIFSTLEQ